MGCTDSLSPHTAVSCRQAATLCWHLQLRCVSGVIHNLPVSQPAWSLVMFPGPLRLSSARPPFRLARHSTIQSPLGGHFTPHHGGTPGQAHWPATFGNSGASDTSGLHPCHTEQMEIWGGHLHSLLQCPTRVLPHVYTQDTLAAGFFPGF